LLVDPDTSRARRYGLRLRLGGLLVVMATQISDARTLIELLPPAVIVAHASLLTPVGESATGTPDDLTTMGIPLATYDDSDKPPDHETADTLVATVRRMLASGERPS
jgi:hypothetical protein